MGLLLLLLLLWLFCLILDYHLRVLSFCLILDYHLRVLSFCLILGYHLRVFFFCLLFRRFFFSFPFPPPEFVSLVCASRKLSQDAEIPPPTVIFGQFQWIRVEEEQVVRENLGKVVHDSEIIDK